MTMRRRGFLERRGAAALLLILFVAGGLVFVFAGTLARATTLEAEATVARSAVAALEASVGAGRAELEFLETDQFIEQLARGVGFGRKGEQAFSLPEDAPEPPAIPPLGTSGQDAADQSPLEAWLGLLFGG